MADGTSGQEVDEQSDALDGHLRLRLLGAGAQVGRDQHAGHLKQRTVGAGFLLEHVEGHAPDHTPFESLHQCFLVVDAATGAVHQPDTLLQDGQFVHADKMAGVVSQRGVDGQVIDLWQHAPHGAHQFDAQLLCPLLRQKRIEAHDPHVERQGSLGHRLADPTEPHDPQRLSRQLDAHKLVAIPAMLMEAGVGRGHVAGEGEDQCERVLRRADGVAGGRVHHHDALPRGRILVDVVGANACTYDRLEPVIAGKRIGSDLHAAAADRPVVAGQSLPQRHAREPGDDFIGDTRFGRRVEERETVRTERVEHNDRGHGFGFPRGAGMQRVETVSTNG